MIYTKEVENMCQVNKGAYHGPAPIPEDKKKDGNKVLIKSYPYMDMSIKYKK